MGLLGPDGMERRNDGEAMTTTGKKDGHTPKLEEFESPIRTDGRDLIGFFLNSWNPRIPSSREEIKIGQMNSAEQAEYVKKAINAYDRDQETIKELVEACKAFVDGHMHDDKVIRLAKAALRRAEETKP